MKVNVRMKHSRFECDRGRRQRVIGAAADGKFEYAAFVGRIDGSFEEGRPVEEGGGGGRSEVDVGVGIAIAGGFFEGLEFFAEAFGGS